MYSKGVGKNVWTLFLLIMAGVVLGGFLGTTLGKLPFMEWITYGNNFGIETPLTLDLGIIVIHFGLMIRFNIGGIIGIILSILIYKKL